MALCLQPCFKIFHTVKDYKEEAAKVIEVKKMTPRREAAAAKKLAKAEAAGPKAKRQKKGEKLVPDFKEVAQAIKSTTKGKRGPKGPRGKKPKTSKYPSPELYYDQAARSTIEAGKDDDLLDEPKGPSEFPEFDEPASSTPTPTATSSSSLDTTPSKKTTPLAETPPAPSTTTSQHHSQPQPPPQTQPQQPAPPPPQQQLPPQQQQPAPLPPLTREGPQFPSPVMYYDQQQQNNVTSSSSSSVVDVHHNNAPATSITQMHRERTQFTPEMYYEQARAVAEAQKNSMGGQLPHAPLPPRPQFPPELYYAEHAAAHAARSAFEAQKNAAAANKQPPPEAQFGMPPFQLNF